MVLNIITKGDPILRKKAQKVADVSHRDIQKMIDDMIETMYAREGIGLAAPQIGESLQIAVVVPDPARFDEYRKVAGEAIVIVNPKIIRHSLLKTSDREGCLSVPHVIGTVKRWKAITVEYVDRTNAKKKLKAAHLMARVVQHEIDHLNGILFIDKAEQMVAIAPEFPAGNAG